MSRFTEKLKEPFDEQLNRYLLQLENVVDQLEAQKDIVTQWPARKKRIVSGIVMPMERWSAKLRHLARPMAWKRYKRGKKRLIRAGRLTWSHWRGFSARSQLTALAIINIIRILLILGFSIGSLLLVGYLIVKLFGLIGGTS